jgi:hypothetical protein
MPAQAKRAPSHHKKHHKITRVGLGEAPRHRVVHRDPPILAHFAAPAPPSPRSPNPTPRAITSLPLPPDEAPAPVAAAPAPTPVELAPVPTHQPASAIIAAALTPKLLPAKPLPKIHPIILPAPPPATPAVLVASGTVSAPPVVADTNDSASFTRVRLPVSRPPLTVKPAPIVKAVVSPAPAPAPPAPKPYVLPGHALPLDEELILINNLNQSHRRRRVPRFFGWIGKEVARPFKFLFHDTEY